MSLAYASAFLQWPKRHLASMRAYLRVYVYLGVALVLITTHCLGDCLRSPSVCGASACTCIPTCKSFVHSLTARNCHAYVQLPAAH